MYNYGLGSATSVEAFIYALPVGSVNSISWNSLEQDLLHFG